MNKKIKIHIYDLIILLILLIYFYYNDLDKLSGNLTYLC